MSLVGLLVALMASSCTPSAQVDRSTGTGRQLADASDQDRAIDKRLFKKGRMLTVLHADGSIRRVLIREVGTREMTVRDNLGETYEIAFKDVRAAQAVPGEGRNAANAALGVFAKSGELTGKGVVYGVVKPVGTVLGVLDECNGGGSWGSWGSGIGSGIGSPSCSVGSSGGISCAPN